MARLPVGVEDMQVFRAFDDMGDGFPGYHILRRYRIPILRDSFPYPLPVLIVQEGDRLAVIRHAGELSALPSIGPGTVAQDVPYGVADDLAVVERIQFLFSTCVPYASLSAS